MVVCCCVDVAGWTGATWAKPPELLELCELLELLELPESSPADELLEEPPDCEDARSAAVDGDVEEWEVVDPTDPVCEFVAGAVVGLAAVVR